MAILPAGNVVTANPTVERTVTAKSAVPAAHLRTLSVTLRSRISVNRFSQLMRRMTSVGSEPTERMRCRSKRLNAALPLSG